MTHLREADERAALAAATTDAGDRPDLPDASDDGRPCSAADQVDAVIAWLVERRYLDAQRFIDSRVHLRAARFGVDRIRQELAQHGLALSADAGHALRASEFDRAWALWQRRFGMPAVAAQDAARQARFLAGRGFSGEVVRQVLRAAAHSAHELETSNDPD